MLWLVAGIHQNAQPGSLQRRYALGGQFFMGAAQKDEALRRNGSSADQKRGRLCKQYF
nr:hypothetical protein SYMBAF_160189 [Serratia symbiotica]